MRHTSIDPSTLHCLLRKTCILYVLIEHQGKISPISHRDHNIWCEININLIIFEDIPDRVNIHKGHGRIHPHKYMGGTFRPSINKKDPMRTEGHTTGRSIGEYHRLGDGESAIKCAGQHDTLNSSADRAPSPCLIFFLTKTKTLISRQKTLLILLQITHFITLLAAAVNRSPKTPSVSSWSPWVLWHPSLLFVPTIEKQSLVNLTLFSHIQTWC